MIAGIEGIRGPAIPIGMLIIGIVLAVSAAVQLASGETRGATGRGLVYRRTSPAYFWYLFAARAVLGIAMSAVSVAILT